MMSKWFSSLAAVCLLALFGCTSGMYTSKVYVDKEDNGVSDYAIVHSLDVKEYTQSMPVVMESSYKSEKYENDLNVLLWGITLGIVPGFSTETRTYDVTVKTPIGEKSGKGYVKASKWLGWIPLFLPYPGIADERSDCAQLPHPGLEKKVEDKLVANLVSQFPKEEYSSFVEEWKKKEAERKRLEAEQEAELKRLEAERAEKERIRLEAERVRLAKEETERKRLEAERAEKERIRFEAERVRLAKEEAERKRIEAERNRLARRVRLIENTMKKDLAAIRKYYADGERYLNPFLKKDRSRDEDHRVDWLSKWSEPRLPLSEAEALEGKALLSEFAEKFLPNAYANYEKKREALLLLQQVFNEEFSEPWTIKNTSPKWNAFNKVLEKFVRARAEYFICHDELCHYWILNKLGVLSDKEFSEIDSKPLAIHLLPENIVQYRSMLLSMNPMEGNVSDFTVKYAPGSNSIYQKMGCEFKELDALLSEVVKQYIQMDGVRYSRVLEAAIAKRNDLVREMNTLLNNLQIWRMNHRVQEMSAEDISKVDAAMVKKLKPFIDSLPSYIKNHCLGPVISDSEIVTIPGMGYKMQRTEVTQMQWMIVMGNNPSEHKGPDLPVGNVSWYDCQDFINRASEMDGRQYRLPTEKEWEYACRAGSTGDYCRLADGREIGKSELDKVAWYVRNSDDTTHPVGQKEPNAFGLYDMHGNVEECCEDVEYSSFFGKRQCVYKGGCFYSPDYSCDTGDSSSSFLDYCRRSSGFRLAVSQD